MATLAGAMADPTARPLTRRAAMAEKRVDLMFMALAPLFDLDSGVAPVMSFIMQQACHLPFSANFGL